MTLAIFARLAGPDLDGFREQFSDASRQLHSLLGFRDPQELLTKCHNEYTLPLLTSCRKDGQESLERRRKVGKESLERGSGS